MEPKNLLVKLTNEPYLSKEKLFYDNQIHLMDCLVGLQQLPDNSADLIIIDPPYNIKKDFGNNKDNLSLAEYLKWVKLWFNQCYRILKPTGIGYIYGFSEILAHISTLIPLEKQRWLIWHYKNKTVPTLNFWQRSHEAIISFWKTKPIFNRDAVRTPYTENFLKNSAGKNRTSTTCRYNKNPNYISQYKAHKNGALPRDVIEVSTLAGGKGTQERFFYCKTCQKLCFPKERQNHLEHQTIFHPTQKPLELTEKLILASKPKGLFNVLIPFAGSGSECKVVKKLKGHYIGFEINSDYLLLANEWIKLDH